MRKCTPKINKKTAFTLRALGAATARDLEGRYLRTLAAGGDFESPKRSQLRTPLWSTKTSTYDDDKGTGNALYIIDIQSGDLLQRIRINLPGDIPSIRVDGDEIFIAGYNASEVVVLRYAGSEA